MTESSKMICPMAKARLQLNKEKCKKGNGLMESISRPSIDITLNSFYLTIFIHYQLLKS